MEIPQALAQHRSHDYRFLIRCWRELAAQAGMKVRLLTRVADLPVFALETKSLAAKEKDEEVIYISTGVHGDEVAGPWGLLEWAKENVEWLREGRFLLFPALNPHGIVMNTRVDQQGRDINRLFHDQDDGLMQAWRKIVAEKRFSIGLCLHEDYDAQGCYLYELPNGHKSVGRAILSDCAEVMRVDERRTVDGYRANVGLIMRRKIPVLPGLPEAIVLYQLGAPLTFTFETPSEFSLFDRIVAQKTFISSALKHGM